MSQNVQCSHVQQTFPAAFPPLNLRILTLQHGTHDSTVKCYRSATIAACAVPELTSVVRVIEGAHHQGRPFFVAVEGSNVIWTCHRCPCCRAVILAVVIAIVTVHVHAIVRLAIAWSDVKVRTVFGVSYICAE